MNAATIVFSDIVGFSQKPGAEQRELIILLNAEVNYVLYRYIHRIDDRPWVISLPTGDGMALAFLHHDEDSPQQQYWEESPIFSLVKRLKEWGETKNIRFRFGIHKGDVSIIRDINHHLNICGDTINSCQRIMDAANPNQVLLSEDTCRRYLGPTNREYSNEPFSAQETAIFSDPIPIIGKHGQFLRVSAMHLGKRSRLWDSTQPHRQQYTDKLERTRFICDCLKYHLEEDPRELTIYEQASFSTFGIIDTRYNTDEADYDPKFFDLITLQKQLLRSLVERPSTTLRLLINPERSSDHRRAQLGCETLLEWLGSKQMQEKQNLHVAWTGFTGTNRLIIKGQFCIEGFKRYDAKPYEMSMVQYQADRIDEAIKEFETEFHKARHIGPNNVAAKIAAYIQLLKSKN